MELPMRKDVPVELTWDLSLLYKTPEEFFADIEDAKKNTDAFAAKFQGKLTSKEAIEECVKEYNKLLPQFDRIGNYGELGAEVDRYDSAAVERASISMQVLSEISSKLTFVQSELSEADTELLESVIALDTDSKHFIKDILREKEHQLSPEVEKVLAALDPSFNTPYEVYNMAKLADMKFDSFEVNGKTYPLGYSLYEDDYEYTLDTEVRRTASKKFYEKLRQYENTNAATFNAYCRHEKAVATLRGFDSVFDYLLDRQKVTREMYDRQIDIITEKLAPHLRKYAKLVKKLHGLDKTTFADLKLPLDPEYTPEISIPMAKEYCNKGLAILGDDYLSMVNEAFDNRWFDFAKNQGKSTGGFCAGAYGRNAYILLSWNNRMSDLFTVAHELGHAGHSRFACKNQTPLNTHMSGYLGEAPSTMNELLMEHYMLKTSDDKRFRRYVLSCMISNTYYHNFVTHLREAWFQREVFKIIDKGGSVNAQVMNELFRKNLEIFWGDDVELTEGCELTWMRQPHYYMGLYSYTYSCGLTLATQVCKRIEEEGAPAVEDWKKMLAAGGTLGPIGLGKLAGVDLTTEKPLLDTVEEIGSIIDEIIKLTEEIENEK